MQNKKSPLEKTKKEKTKKEKTKKEKTKKEKKNKTKLKRKQKITQKKAKGPFKDKTVIINQLQQRKLPDDLTKLITRHFAASTIQDASRRYNPKRDLFETLMIRGLTRYITAGKGNDHFINQLWTNLNPFNEFTAKWLIKASKVLIRSDFDFENRNFWWKIMEKMLQQISEIEEDDEPLQGIPDFAFTGNEHIYYQESKDAIIKILKKNGFIINEPDWVKLHTKWKFLSEGIAHI